MSYASLLHYIRNFDRKLAITLFTESKLGVNGSARRESTVAGLMTETGRRQSLIPPTQKGYAAIETGAGRMGMYVDLSEAN